MIDCSVLLETAASVEAHATKASVAVHDCCAASWVAPQHSDDDLEMVVLVCGCGRSECGFQLSQVEPGVALDSSGDHHDLFEAIPVLDPTIGDQRRSTQAEAAEETPPRRIMRKMKGQGERANAEGAETDDAETENAEAVQPQGRHERAHRSPRSRS